MAQDMCHGIVALGEMGNPTLVEALNDPDLLAERQLARAALVQAF